jgi:hypothetical protein
VSLQQEEVNKLVEQGAIGPPLLSDGDGESGPITAYVGGGDAAGGGAGDDEDIDIDGL